MQTCSSTGVGSGLWVLGEELELELQMKIDVSFTTYYDYYVLCYIVPLKSDGGERRG
jgi:hypothetical protein